MSNSTLSIIIPVYNEEGTITTLLDRVAAVELEGVDKEVVIVNDGSTDRSRELIGNWAEQHDEMPGLSVFVVDKENGGKGSAVRTGIEQSTGDVVIIQDADLEYDPNDYRKCIAPILAGESKVVYGSRERFAQNRSHSSWSFYLGGLTVTYWFNLLYGVSMTDEPTCYKTFDGTLIRQLLFKGDAFEWEPELTAKLLRLGYTIDECPISYQPRKVDEGKKIGWRDGIQALWVAFLWRFLPIGTERRKLAQLPSEAPRIHQHRRRGRWLWGIVGLAFLARLLISLPGLTASDASLFSRPDTSTYIQPALALLAKGQLDQGPTIDVAATLRPPGTALWIAFIYGLTGHSWRLLVISLAAIGALICVPVFKAGERLGGLSAGIVGAALIALNITAIAAAPLILSDTLYAWFAAWQFYFFLRFTCTQRLLDVWLAVALGALSCLIRPSGLPWILPGLFLILVYPRKSWRKKGLGAAGAIAIFALILAPWLVRQNLVGAGFRLDTNMGNTLLYHNVPALMSVVTGESAETMRQRFQQQIAETFAENPLEFQTPASRLEYQVARARPYIRDHLPTYIRLHIQPLILLPDAPSFFELLGLTQSGGGTLDVLRREGLFAAVRHYFGDRLWLLLPLLPLLAIAGLTYAASGVQLIRWLGQGKWYLGLLFLGFVPYFLVLPGPIVMPRYHLPALPMLSVMAALLLTAAWIWLRQRTWRKSTSTNS